MSVNFEGGTDEKTGKQRAQKWSAAGGGGSSYGAQHDPHAAARFSPYGALPPAYGMPQPGPGLPPGWECVPDPASGRPYYCNRATGESSWTPPAAPMQYAPPPQQYYAPPPQAGGLPAGWEAATDPSSGKQYYFNRATNQTTWDRPM